MTGSQMTWLALPWFVFVTTGSATRMSYVVAAELIGLAAFGLPGAKMLARIGARRTMLACDALRAPLLLAIPLLHWAGALPFAALVALAFAVGALSAPYFAAQKMIVPELLGEDETLVSRASALFQAAIRVTMLLGPLVAGVLIGVVGAPAVLVVDAATFVVAFALVLGLVSARGVAAPDGSDGGILTGLRFLVREPLLRVWSPAFAIGDAAWSAFFIAVPVLVVDRFGEDARVAGWLLASFGVGALLGNGVAYRFLLERTQGLTLVAACIMGQALPLWLLPLDLPAAGLSAALLLSGIANGLVNPSIHALITLRIPPALRPTTMSAMVMLWGIVPPLAVFAAGPVLDAAGTGPVLVGFAAVQTAAMAVVAVTSLRARRPLERQLRHAVAEPG